MSETDKDNGPFNDRDETPTKDGGPLNLYGYNPPADELDHIAPNLRPLAFPTEECLQDNANARYHSPKNYDATKNSLKRFQQREAIIIRSDNHVIEAGNLRQKIFEDMGWHWIAVNMMNDDSMSATAFAIADNRTGELADWDYENLLPQLETLQSEWDDWSSAGFSAQEVEMLDNAYEYEEDWGEGIDDIEEMGEEDEMQARLVVTCKPEHRESIKRQVRIVLKGIEGAKIQ